jgi:gliding motility-associated lipoprotein GldD
MRALIFFLIALTIFSCGEETVVKPSAQLRLEYPKPHYEQVEAADCPFAFQKNKQAQLERRADCWMNLHYPQMNASLYITYQPVRADNLDSLLYDAQKLTYDHTVKANSIFEQPRVDSVQKVYGMFYMLEGNAATQSQFYVTDSTKHFLTGSLYFNAKPNYDSLYPAIAYLREDIRKLMETLTWRNN